MKLYLDSDVLLDLLMDRAPFADDIAQVITISRASNVQLCASPITITSINYIIGKIENQSKARSQVKKLLQLVAIENVGQTEISSASNSIFNDFEDAVQNFCATNAGHEIIITRNTKDYKASELAVMTPSEYLAKHMSEG